MTRRKGFFILLLIVFTIVWYVTTNTLRVAPSIWQLETGKSYATVVQGRGDRIYVGFDQTLEQVDARTGHVLWRQQLPASFRLFSIVGGDGAIAAIQNWQHGASLSTTLMAFGEEAKPKWTATVPDVPGQPYLLNQDRIVVPGRKINVLDSHSGRLIARIAVHEARDEDWDRSYDNFEERRFALAGGLFVLDAGANTSDCCVQALTPKGKEVWKNPMPTNSMGSAHNPVTINADRGSVVYTDPEGNVVSANVRTGDLRWVYATGLLEPSYVSLAPNGDVLVASFHGNVVKLDHTNGHPLWKVKIGNDCRSAPLLVDKQVLLGTDGNALVSLEASSGRERLRSRVQSYVPFFGSFEIAMPQLVLDRMAIITTDGSVRAIRLP